MAKDAAFGIQLEIGTAQTEYASIVCDTSAGITTSGNGTFTVTHSGLAGSPLATSVALLEDDLPADIVTKAVAALNAIGAISTHMVFYAVGNLLYCRLVAAVANDATLNIAYADGTSAGLTDDASSTVGVAGVALATTAQITGLNGPGLAVDTEDVTTHDQSSAFEELIATIIRSGEISLDIVYDPAHATHDASTGLIYRLEDQIFSYFVLTFPDTGTTEWTFFGYLTGFEPGGPVDGALTATVKIKITAVPTLA